MMTPEGYSLYLKVYILSISSHRIKHVLKAVRYQSMPTNSPDLRSLLLPGELAGQLCRYLQKQIEANSLHIKCCLC